MHPLMRYALCEVRLMLPNAKSSQSDIAVVRVSNK